MDAAAADLGLAPGGEKIHRFEADAVQAAGGFVAVLVELAPHVEVGHHRFEVRDFAAFFLRGLVVPLDRNAAAIVLDRARSRRC